MACRCISGASTPPPRCIGVDQIIGGIVEEAWLLCAQVHSAARSGDELGCDGGGRALQGAAKKGPSLDRRGCPVLAQPTRGP